jgi:2-desacetyl-2-hydroxyethyl bacteriochlorophyllide A dehydrogenase
MELMRALSIDSPGTIKVVSRERPAVGPGEVLLKINWAGFCGSDLSTFLGKNPMIQYPRVPGHELSAEIIEKGKDVPDSLSPGDLVTVVPYTSCGKCPSCRRGRSHACQFNQTLGVQRDGGMQEYLAIPWQNVLKGKDLDALQLVMVEPLTVGFHAIERGRVGASDTVAVMGCGMIGAGAVIRAALVGARVIAVDIDDQKLELARELGASRVINSVKEDLHEKFHDLTNGEGPDVMVEAAGNPLTYRAAVEEVAFTGRVVCIGYTGQEVSFLTQLFVQKEIDILGSRNAASDDFMAVISYLEEGRFPLEKMITRKVNPENAREAMDFWAGAPARVMKILVNFTE